MVLAVALSLPLTIGAQTVSNGNLQVLGSFDASAGTWSKPMVAVAADPSGSCSNAAAMVVNTATGSQQGDISVCLNGVWTLVTGGSLGGGSGFAQYAPSYVAGGVTFGSCSTGAPCYLAPNNQLNAYVSTPMVTPGAGTAQDTLYIYGIPGSNIIQVGKNSTNTYGCVGCQVNSGISAPPSNSYPIYKCTVTGGQVLAGGCTPLSTPYANTGFENGLGTLPLIDTTTGALQINNNRNPRIVTSGNDAITNLDCGGIVIYSEASAVNVALPQAGTGSPATFASGCDIWLVNIGAGRIQITPNANSPINGSNSVQTLPAAGASFPSSMYLVSNGTRFYAVSSFNGGAINNELVMNGPFSVAKPQMSIVANSGYAAGFSLIPSGLPGWIVDSATTTGNLNFYDMSSSKTELSLATGTGLVDITQGLLQLGTQITPASSSATCSTGTVEADANYIYVCTASNSFKRVALSSF